MLFEEVSGTDLCNKLVGGGAASHEVVHRPLQAGQVGTGGRAVGVAFWGRQHAPCQLGSSNGCWEGQLEIACTAFSFF